MQFDDTIPAPISIGGSVSTEIGIDDAPDEPSGTDSTRPDAGMALDDTAMFRLVYPELRRLARARMRLLPARSALQATALVHEVYLRLHKKAQTNRAWNGRAHFMAVAARVMWFIVVDHIRSELALRRGGRQIRVTFTDSDAPLTLHSDEILDLERALNRLHRESPELAQVVILRFVSGLKVRDIAELQDVSVRTVQRQWHVARTWLRRELARTRPD